MRQQQVDTKITLTFSADMTLVREELRLMIDQVFERLDSFDSDRLEFVDWKVHRLSEEAEIYVFPKKFPTSDAAAQIAEEAFRMGFLAGFEARQGNCGQTCEDWYSSWCEYEPSENVKELCRD